MSMLTNMERNVQQAFERQQRESDMYETGDINTFQYGLRSTANLLDATLGNVVGETVSAVTPAFVERGMEQAGQALMNTSAGQYAGNLARQYPETARDLGAALSVAESIPLVRGASKAFKAGQAVDQMTGPQSGKGMLTASANNVIPGYYGPQRAGAIATWLPNQVYNTTRDLVSPESRAKYREQGITTTSQQIMGKALAKNDIEDSLSYNNIYKYMGFDPKGEGPHRAEAAVQYLDRVHGGSGRVGKRDLVQEAMLKSDLVDYTRWYPGSYKDLIKSNKLKPYPMIAEGIRGKRPASIPDSDLDFIEDHFGSVWTEPSALPFKTDIPFAEARRPVIAIKSAGKGGSQTGKHYKDVLIDAPFAKEVRRLFPEGTAEVSPSLLRETLESASAASKDLDRKYQFTVMNRPTTDGSVWVTGSRPGSAITEGGINYIAKVSPKGTIMGVMSDEHNLFEGIAGKAQKYTLGAVPALSAMRYLLPHRFIAVTPPMMTDVKKGVKYIERQSFDTPAGRTKKPIDDRLGPIVNYKPSSEVLEQEVKRQRGVQEAGVGAGLMAVTQEDEERGR